MSHLKSYLIPGFLLLFSVSAFVASATEPTPDFMWAKRAGSNGDDYGNGIALDGSGNVYVAGSFALGDTGNGSATFGTNTLTSSGEGDIFLAKYNSAGTVLWARKAGSGTDDEAYTVTVDAAGNAYVGGRFTGTATFGTISLTTAAGHDMFLAKYDTAGNCLWARKAGGPNTDYANGISTDPSGNIFVTGVFSNSMTIGTSNLTSVGLSKDMFLAKYNSAGNFLWAKKAGSTGSDVGWSVCADNAGNAVVTGWYPFTNSFGGTNILDASGNQDFFVAKYDGAGNILWARHGGGGTNYDYAYGAVCDNAGNVYVAGVFEGTVAADGLSLDSSGGADVLLVKYDPLGRIIWLRQGGGIGDDGAFAITKDIADNIYVTGYFAGTATFGSTTLTSAGDSDIFITKYDTAGNVIWAKRAGGSSYDNPNAVAVNVSGYAYVTGFFHQQASFGTNTLNSSGSNPRYDDEIFVTKLTSVGIQPAISHIGLQLFFEDTSTGPIDFTVWDVETPAANLIVTASSENTNRVPNANIVLGGSGTNRTVTITPATNQIGTATITLTVTDANGLSTSDSFIVAMGTVNDFPTLNAITNRTILQNAGPQTVPLSGITSGAANENDTLSVTATSSNPALIPDPQVSYTSPNTTGTLTFTPVLNATGTTTITVSVYDGGPYANQIWNSFTVTVTSTATPTLSPIADQVTNEGTPTGAIPFTVNDAQTPADSLVVTGTSSNTSLVPNANILLGGSGNNRTVTITPAANQTGVTTITLTVTDGTGLTASNTFQVTVIPAVTGEFPRLQIALVGSDVVVSWPTNATGFVLQASDRLDSPGAWIAVNIPPVVVGDRYAVTIAMKASSQYFRLVKPLLGEPTLAITLSGSNIILSWPTNFVGYVLQATPDFSPTSVWTNVTKVPLVVADRYTVTDALIGGSKYYRLFKPASGPLLSIASLGNTAVISWPSSAGGYTLEATDTLPASSWSTVTNTPSLQGGKYSVTVDSSTGNRFYRLRSQ